LGDLVEDGNHVLTRRSDPMTVAQPFEDGEVTISRAAMSLTFLARFMLASAMNPCPWGCTNWRVDQKFEVQLFQFLFLQRKFWRRIA